MDRLKLYLLAFFLFIIRSGFIICEDQSFTIAFMTNAGTKCISAHKLILYIAASEIASCLISAPKTNFSTAINVNANDCVKVELPTSLELQESAVEQKGISATCNTTVTVYGVNTCEDCTDGFSVIPNSYLGKEYVAFTVLPSSIDFKSQVAVVSYLNNTVVSVCLPFCADCQVNISANTYGPGSCIHQTLNAYEALQIQSYGNLAGTYISSNNPVAVFSGNDKSSVSDNNENHLVTQVPPSKLWGKQFVAISTVLHDSQVFIITGTNDTNVNISCTRIDTIKTDIVSVGDIFMKPLSRDEYCFIETDNPVFVAQVIERNPSLLYLTPIDQYTSNFSFIPPKMTNDKDFYLIYVIDKSAESNLTIDPADHINWYDSKNIPGTTLVGGSVRIPDNLNRCIRHPYAPFNGILLGFGDSDSYAISLGWNWKTTANNDISTSPLYETIGISTAAVTTDEPSTYLSISPGMTITSEMTTTTDMTTTSDMTTTLDMTTTADMTTITYMTTTTDITTTPDMTTTTDMTTTPDMLTTPDMTLSTDIATITSDMETTTDKTTTLDMTTSTDIMTTTDITTALDMTETSDISKTVSESPLNINDTCSSNLTCYESSTDHSTPSSISIRENVTSPKDLSVCKNKLEGSYFVDMAQGYVGFDIITELIMQSVFQCALQCQRQDLCRSFQYDTQTGSCFLLRAGGSSLDPGNGQIFTLEC